jgi:hypothetical protein
MTFFQTQIQVNELIRHRRDPYPFNLLITFRYPNSMSNDIPLATISHSFAHLIPSPSILHRHLPAYSSRSVTPNSQEDAYNHSIHAGLKKGKN